MDDKRVPPLPCPFCGHVGLDFQEGSTFRWLQYSCGRCGISNETRVQTLGDGTPEEWRAAAERDAVKQWNTRIAIAPQVGKWCDGCNPDNCMGCMTPQLPQGLDKHP